MPRRDWGKGGKLSLSLNRSVLKYRHTSMVTVKNLLPAVLLGLAMTSVCCQAGSGNAAPPLVTAPKSVTEAPPPAAVQAVAKDAVPVPETIGASVLAGVAFLMMFSRRRYT
ncbi:MAG: hypothetical protein JWM59_1843 [Verrucomicrobiales bacterium]|nr:hypothetical protein [Verrucomicrobiales bacterium]